MSLQVFVVRASTISRRRPRTRYITYIKSYTRARTHTRALAIRSGGINALMPREGGRPVVGTSMGRPPRHTPPIKRLLTNRNGRARRWRFPTTSPVRTFPSLPARHPTLFHDYTIYVYIHTRECVRASLRLCLCVGCMCVCTVELS